MKLYEVYVPTHGRKRPAIVEMLTKDENLRLIFCVREEVIDLYDDLKKEFEGRIEILNLGTDIHDLGETRRRILHMAENRCEYCIMLDDGLTDIRDKYNQYDSISDCIGCAIKMMLSEDAFCYTFFREGNRFLGVSDDDKYFVGLPLQAFIIDTKKSKEHNIEFKPMSECGLEDVAFFIDSVKEAQIFISDQGIVIEGKLPNVVCAGGSHDTHSTKEHFEKHRDEGHKKLMEYIGPMYGVMLTKKYRPSLDQVLTYCRIDFEYFRDCLVYHEKENEQIVKNKFRIEE